MEYLKPQDSIVRETKRMAIGCGICLAVMLIVYAVIGQFTYKVLLGGLIGTAYAVFNFFQLGMTIQKATTVTTDKDVAARYMRSSYSRRMIGLVAVCILCYVLPFTEFLPSVIAQVFPRLTILLLQVTGQIHD